MRTIVQVIAAVFNFAIDLYLIPRYSWLGAAWASLITDALMGIGNWLVYLLVCRLAMLAGSSDTA
jgi:O-antigen/teichoic acid export membrane protein